MEGIKVFFGVKELVLEVGLLFLFEIEVALGGVGLGLEVLELALEIGDAGVGLFEEELDAFGDGGGRVPVSEFSGWRPLFEGVEDP